jgi:hypothetical protein
VLEIAKSAPLLVCHRTRHTIRSRFPRTANHSQSLVGQLKKRRVIINRDCDGVRKGIHHRTRGNS